MHTCSQTHTRALTHTRVDLRRSKQELLDSYGRRLILSPEELTADWLLDGSHAHLLKPLLPQTDHVQVKVCPEAVGPVEGDSPGQTVPVGLEGERVCDRTHTHTHTALILAESWYPLWS